MCYNRSSIIFAIKKFKTALWRRLYIAVLICFGVLILISKTLQIVNGFVDLRGLAFTVCVWLSLALQIIFLILIVICYGKIRKLKKFLFKSEGDGNNVAVKEAKSNEMRCIMKILVTGGTVFVSKFIAEYFANYGNEVYVLNRNTKPQLPNVKLIHCDRKNINGRLKGLHFDSVIDVTAYTAEDINTLLDSLESFNNYVMISSSAVYPETLEMPFKESGNCGRNKFWGDYGTNKIAAENALLQRVPDAYIIRPPYLYGEYDNIYREAFVFDCAERDLPFYLPVDGSMLLQFFHVEDLCRIIEALIINQPERKIFNVGNAPVTIREWAESCLPRSAKLRLS